MKTVKTTEETRREYQRNWRINNRDKVLENNRKWRINNPEAVALISKKQRKIRKTDRSKMASVLLGKTLISKRRKTGNLEHNLTTADIDAILKKQKQRCAFTGIWLDHKTGNNNLTMASVDRINSKKGYLKSNVQIVALAINRAKGESTDKEFRKFLKVLKETNRP